MPQEPWPRITVVTPNLNGAAFLEQTILSVSGQDYPNLEYIVVDGGSTDASLDILQRHSHRISHLIQGPDRNLYDAVARGFDAATGDILAWLNSDDLYEPGALHRAAEAFRSHPERQVIYFNSSILKDGWRLQNRPQRPAGYQELMSGHILYQESVFFTRAAYQSVGGLDRIHFRLAGDYDLWLRLAARHPFHFIPATAACFRIRPGQLSGNPAQYQREMEVARLLAIQREAHHAPVQTIPADNPASGSFTFPLHNEHLPWPVLDTPEVTVSARCPPVPPATSTPALHHRRRPDLVSLLRLPPRIRDQSASTSDPAGVVPPLRHHLSIVSKTALQTPRPLPSHLPRRASPPRRTSPKPA